MNHFSKIAACLEGQGGAVQYVMGERKEGTYHGTGDLFASALLGGLLHGRSLEYAIHLAMTLVSDAIVKTQRENGPEREGVLFEPCLADYSKALAPL